MTKKDFLELIEDLELTVLESFTWPVALIIDPEILNKAFPQTRKLKITKYKLPITKEVIPVMTGKRGEFYLKPSSLLDRNI